MVTRTEIFDACDELRSREELVSQTSIMALLLVKTGRKGSPRDIGPYLLEWKAEKEYAPALARGGVPPTVASGLSKATAALWSAAQEEASGIHDADRRRFEVTLHDERALRAEALAMADGLLAQADALKAAETVLRARVAELESELAEARRHTQAVRADHFWDRVVHDIHALLPEAGSMRVVEIMDQLGADLAEEARSHPEGWSIKTIRKKIETRIFHKRLFARAGKGTYRRRQVGDNPPDATPDE